MSYAFTEIRTIPASKKAKALMNKLIRNDIFEQKRDIWTLGAALGIKLGKTYEGGTRETFQNVNSLDPEGVFSAIMLGLYPDSTPKFRLTKLVDHAEWGIREIARRDKNGTLDLAKLADTANFMVKREKERGKIPSEENDVQKIIQQGERNNVEFKSSMLWDYKENRINPEMAFEVAKTICAFMNTEGGGYLLVGVKDDSTILGLANDFKVIRKKGKSNVDLFGLRFTSIVCHYLGKQNRPYVKLNFTELEGKSIAVINVPNKAPKRVFIFPKKDVADFYIRLGNASHRLNTQEAADYIEQHW